MQRLIEPIMKTDENTRCQRKKGFPHQANCDKKNDKKTKITKEDLSHRTNYGENLLKSFVGCRCQLDRPAGVLDRGGDQNYYKIQRQCAHNHT